MIRLGPFALLRLDSLAAQPPALDDRHRCMVERTLMTALNAADAYLHEDARAPGRERRKRIVCEQIEIALSEGYKLGF